MQDSRNKDDDYIVTLAHTYFAVWKKEGAFNLCHRLVITYIPHLIKKETTKKLIKQK